MISHRSNPPGTARRELGITPDTLLGSILVRDPAAGDRLQGLGLSEPILCGPYRQRSVADLARGIGVPVDTLIAVLDGEPG